jgi:hypothetical protein
VSDQTVGLEKNLLMAEALAQLWVQMLTSKAPAGGLPMRLRNTCISLLSLCLCLGLVACGVGGSQSVPPPGQNPPPNPPPPVNNVSVSVSPTTATVTIGQSTNFSATVKNTTNTAVTWNVNGVAGGNSSVGTISAAGVYTAPGKVPSATVSISATSAADTTKSASATVSVKGFSGMLAWHQDSAITGQNSNETVLTKSNVNQGMFGKLFSYQLDEQSFAQPLYVSNVPFPGAGQHNAIYVATERNTVYAFDADNGGKAPFWQKSLMPSGATPVDGTKTGGIGGPITPVVGITGTPVIDGSTGTLYVVSVTQESSGQVHRLHALDITTGNEKFGGPVPITATVPGTGAGSSGGQVTFDPKLELQRSALTLVNGVVYIAWASYQDFGNYHGWIMGYDASTLNPVRVWNTTPNGGQGGIWMSGAPISSDSAGNLYIVVGNGTFDANNGGKDYGDSFVKLTPNGSSFTVSDFFTPFDQANLSANDIDVGSSGLTLLLNLPGPETNLGVSAGKSGKIYLVDLDNMGKFQSGSDNQIVQSIPNAIGSQPSDNDYSTAAYWNGNVYFIGNMDVLKQYQLSNGQLSTSPIKGSHTYGYPGANMSISSNGSSNGILWTIEASGVNVLHAYDANDVSTELYNSNQAGSRDQFGAAIRFTVPTVINGKVYVAGQTKLAVFGLL